MKEKEYELNMGNYPLIRESLAELGYQITRKFPKLGDIDTNNWVAIISKGSDSISVEHGNKITFSPDYPIGFEIHNKNEKTDKHNGGSEMSEVFGNMFESMFGGALGYTGKGMVRLGLNGEMAVKTGPDSNPVYKTYNVKTGRLTNVTNFCFDIGTELFFIMPTTKVATGDILLVDGHPKCVIANNDNKTIKVMDYENSAIQEIVPERHVFMGKAYFYRKIVSMFGSTGFFKNGKGPENIMKLAMKAKMLQTVMGGKNAFGGMGNDGGLGSIMPLMVMGSMFGGGAGGDMFGDFSEMFDFSLIDAPEDDEADGEETEEELEAKLAALRAKKGKTDKAAE